MAGNFVADLGHVNKPEMPWTATRPETILLQTDKSFEVFTFGPGKKWETYPSLRFSDLAKYGESSFPLFAELVESSYYSGEVETTAAMGRLDLIGKGLQRILPTIRTEDRYEYLHDTVESGPTETQLFVVFKNGYALAGNPKSGNFRRLGQIFDFDLQVTKPSVATVQIWQYAKAIVFWNLGKLDLVLFRGDRSGRMSASLPKDDVGPIQEVKGETFDVAAGSTAALNGGLYVGTGRIIVTTPAWINLFRVKDGKLVFEERVSNTRVNRIFH